MNRARHRVDQVNELIRTVLGSKRYDDSKQLVLTQRVADALDDDFDAPAALEAIEDWIAQASILGIRPHLRDLEAAINLVKAPFVIPGPAS